MVRPTLSIGEVARRAHLRSSAIRYYEQLGLIGEPERVSGRRRYQPSIVRRLALIKMSQKAGFTLREIGQLLSAHPDDESSADQWRELAERKLPELDAFIDEIIGLRDAVKHCLECGCMSFENCLLLEPPTEPSSTPQA